MTAKVLIFFKYYSLKMIFVPTLTRFGKKTLHYGNFAPHRCKIYMHITIGAQICPPVPFFLPTRLAVCTLFITFADENETTEHMNRYHSEPNKVIAPPLKEP